LTDYIAGRLERAIDQVLAATGEKPILVGYCMGGLLALAAAQRRKQDLAGLALLATPWDFHIASPCQARAVAGSYFVLAPMMAAVGELPVDVIQALFASLDPMLVARKFLRFDTLDPGSADAENFVALEDWLNDGVALTLSVAEECLVGWYGENRPANGNWLVAESAVCPQAVDLPSLCVLPSGDRIVPPKSALALAEALPRCDRLEPNAGHIGMIASTRAQEKVWRPLGDWLERAAG
jgi:polyhydroxyalkanoate synthase